MSYVTESLMPNEEVILQARPHWIIFGTPITYLVAAILFLIIGHQSDFLNEEYFWQLELYQFISLILFLLAIVTTLSMYVAYIASEFGITSKRVLVKVGLIHRQSLEFYFDRIESIMVYQNIIARILNYGTIVIHGIGGGYDSMRHVPNPARFRALVLEQVERVTTKA